MRVDRAGVGYRLRLAGIMFADGKAPAVVYAFCLGGGKLCNADFIRTICTHCSATHTVTVCHIQYRIADHIVAVLRGVGGCYLAERVSQLFAVGNADRVVPANGVCVKSALRIGKDKQGIIRKLFKMLNNMIVCISSWKNPNTAERVIFDHLLSVGSITFIPNESDHGHAEFLLNRQVFQLEFFKFLHAYPSFFMGLTY